MPFKFKKASCVVVGSFNIYIIHPKWLVKHKIIQDEVEVAIQFNLEQAGFRYHIPKHKVTWNVAPDRIVVESEDPEVDCGDFLSKMLIKLPETPLFAIGNNVIYEAEKDELNLLAQTIRDFISSVSQIGSETLVQQSFHVALERQKHEIVNLQISIKNDRIVLMSNVHTNLRDRSDSCDAAVKAAMQFIEDKNSVKPLVHHYFGMTIEHGTYNT
ncbi:MAG TPA: hypothetical protein VIH42_15385 [Thermoguttaceae bacterium]